MRLYLSVFVLTVALWGLAWLALHQRRKREPGVVNTPTITGNPATVRPLNGVEREAYRLLTEALPHGYLLLAQVALARFIRVSQRTSYRAWYDRIGHRCVDFLVCNGEGEVVVVVELDEQSGRDSRYQQVVLRKARVLEVAGVPVSHWVGADLPTVTQVREILEKAATTGGLRARQLASVPSDLVPLSTRRATRPAPLMAEKIEARNRWQENSPGTTRGQVGDTFNFEHEGIVLSSMEQRALGSLLRTPGEITYRAQGVGRPV